MEDWSPKQSRSRLLSSWDVWPRTGNRKRINEILVEAAAWATNKIWFIRKYLVHVCIALKHFTLYMPSSHYIIEQSLFVRPHVRFFTCMTSDHRENPARVACVLQVKKERLSEVQLFTQGSWVSEWLLWNYALDDIQVSLLGILAWINLLLIEGLRTRLNICVPLKPKCWNWCPMWWN